MQLNPDLDLELSRSFTAPPSVIWRCWIEPALLCQWFCPKPWRVAEAVIDARAGGRFYSLMQGPNGEESPNEGSLVDVVAGRKLVFTDLFEADFKPVASPGLGFVAIVTFDPEGSGTRYRAVARHRTAAEAETHRSMGFHAGWGAAAAQLEELSKGL